MFERLRAILGGRTNALASASMGGAGALHEAVKRGDLAVVKDLIARGADLEAQTPDGWTPLIEAVREDIQIVTALLDAGANVNAASIFGYTALQRAAGQGRAEVVRLLLARGANAAAVDNAGKSAMDFAAERNDSECVDLLTQAGAPRRGGGDDSDGGGGDGRNFEADFAKFTQMLGMAHNVAGAAAASGAVQISGGDGSSTAAAVVIRAPALVMGVAAEYEYLQSRFGPRQPTPKGAFAAEPPAAGWMILKVACMEEGGRQFDRMEIVVAGGAARTIYFDITDFYTGGNPLPLLMAHAMSDTPQGGG